MCQQLILIPNLNQESQKNKLKIYNKNTHASSEKATISENPQEVCDKERSKC